MPAAEARPTHFGHFSSLGVCLGSHQADYMTFQDGHALLWSNQKGAAGDDTLVATYNLDGGHSVRVLDDAQLPPESGPTP